MTPSHRTKTHKHQSAAACSRCTRVDVVRDDKEGAAKKLLGRGWTVIGDKLVCPECEKKAAEGKT